MQSRRCCAVRGAVVVSALLLAACEQQNKYVAPPPPRVTVVAPVQQQVTRYLEANGHSAAVNSANLVARARSRWCGSSASIRSPSASCSLAWRCGCASMFTDARRAEPTISHVFSTATLHLR